MGESISDRRLKAILRPGVHCGIQGHQDDDVSRHHIRRRSDAKHDAPSLVWMIFSRTSSTKIAGRGVAMTAETTRCSYCGKQGHYAHNCWKKKDDDNSKSTGFHDKQKSNDSSKVRAESKDTAEQKWCSVSVHKITPHSDEGCYKQGPPHPPQSGGAHIASALLGASTRPANDDETLSLNFGDGFDQGFAFTGLLAGSGRRSFHLHSGRVTMIVNSGPSDHLMDDEMIPRLRNSMRGYKKLKKPSTILTAGNENAFAKATYIIWDTSPGWPACSCSHLGHVVICTGAQPLLLRQCNAIRDKHYPRGEKPPTCSSAATLHLRLANTQRTEANALTEYFFAPCEARLICHQRLLLFLQHTQAPTSSEASASRKRSKNSASITASPWKTPRRTNGRGYPSGMDKLL